MQQAYRQGDVLLLVDCEIPEGCVVLPHAVLAEGEATGHRHRITKGEVRHFLDGRTQRRWLAVDSPTALLTHDEHGPVALKRGSYEIVIQRSYSPEGWKRVVD